MKIRTGFVSNSSSSSFAILKEDLKPEQIIAIKNYIDGGKILNEQLKLDRFNAFECEEVAPDAVDAWVFREDDVHLEGSTIMDNFDMEQYIQMIGVDMTKVQWGSHEAPWHEW